MEEKKSDNTQYMIFACLGVIMVLAIYRKGIKHGYKDAMGIVDDICSSAAKALDITKF